MLVYTNDLGLWHQIDMLTFWKAGKYTCIFIYKCMRAGKHIQILLWIPHMPHRENKLLDILIFKFNFHKFRYFQQRINAVIHFWYFACKQRLQGLSVREHEVKQASKQNTLQYNTFEDIPVVVQEWSVHLHRCPSLKTNHQRATKGGIAFKISFMAMTWCVSWSSILSNTWHIVVCTSCVTNGDKFPFWKQFHSQFSICAKK